MQSSANEYLEGLRGDHARFSRVLTMIGRDARRLVEEAEEVLPVFEEAVDYVVSFQNVHHHPREEVMFAKVAELSPSLVATAERLSREHEVIDRAGRRMQTLLQDAAIERADRGARERLARELAEFANAMRRHIIQEEELLYSRAWADLEDRDWEDLASAAPPDPLGYEEDECYPLLAAYVTGGSARSEVSVEGGRIARAIESGLDRAIQTGAHLRKMRGISQQHRSEARAIARKSIKDLPALPMLRPMESIRVGSEWAREIRQAHGRWIQDWQECFSDLAAEDSAGSGLH